MNFQSEPVRITAALGTFINALILMLQGFGVIHWTGDQVALVMTAWNAAVGVFLATFVRASVSPTP